MRVYENILIFSPSIDEEEIEKEIKDIEIILKQHKGEIISVDKWGKKKLAYPIKKNDTGYYLLMNLKLETKILPELELKYKLNQNIMRYNIVQKEENG